MSTDPDYDFNAATPAADRALFSGVSLHLPFALLSSAIAIVMIAQTAITFKTKSALQVNKAQLADLHRNQEPVVKQSLEVQKKLEGIVLDLLLLAATDPEAKAIVTKYGIQQNLPAGSGTAPAATPAP